MIDLNGYEAYLRKIGFAETGINTYKNYISDNKLDILNNINEYRQLSDRNKLIKFSNEDKSFEEEFNKYHNYQSKTTFSDLRSGARRYKHYLQYLEVIDTIKDYNNNPNNYPLNNSHIYFKVFDDNKYPVKAICRAKLDILELQENFTFDNGKRILEKIFNHKYKKNLTIIDVNQNSIATNTQHFMQTKNIILYGSPGVGKTHNYQRIISLIENRTSEKEIFDTITNNEKIELNNDAFKTIKDETRVEFVTFHQSYSYEDFIEGFRPQKNGNIELKNGIFKNISKEALQNKEQNYYIVIDEINRGNISKIFGELITLIEEDKRDIYEVTLPYSKMPFTVPSNLYIIATMNSTDKSIATIDIALRRRFTFLKMKPSLELVENANAKSMMKKLNIYITNTLGEDYQLGHSYFMKVQNDDDLEFIKEYKIKPLLEEYFYAEDKSVDEILNEALANSDG